MSDHMPAGIRPPRAKAEPAAPVIPVGSEAPRVIERRECGRCGAMVREGKKRHFCGKPYPLKVTEDIRVVRYVAEPHHPGHEEGAT